MRRIFIVNSYVAPSTIELTARVCFGDVHYRETDAEILPWAHYAIVYEAEQDNYYMVEAVAVDILANFLNNYEDEIDNATFHADNTNKTQFRLLLDKLNEDFTLSGFVISSL